MIEVKQVYKCEGCGVIVEVLHGGDATLICCEKPMAVLDENSTDAATEKHVPVIERVDGGVLVKVGSVEHPMQDTHYIEWIELHAGSRIYRQHLKPGEKPEAFFKLQDNEEIQYAREYCNLHGLWRTK
ncbi:desulfoferrodoxin [Fonticella tunisiensis]|uniref:Desulfoferrodoxin n=1 Tax=Fonticella tunisiensis TaxID=1096341 RepID=A0A4R7KPB5_9CLOT|nr:desulfoferrodoxin [Fonticella tunisiensis]TDT60951.1 superoxide reductase [Fonticella tunisiensis]